MHWRRCDTEGYVQQIFMIAFHAADWRIDEIDRGTPKADHAVANAIDSELAGSGLTHDASFADVLAASLELRFDKNDGAPMPLFTRYRKGREDSRNDKGCGDERDIHCNEDGCVFGIRSNEFAGFEQAGVRALAQCNASIVTKFFGDLAIAGVHGEHAARAVLQHAVREAASGGPDIDAGNTS